MAEYDALRKYVDKEILELTGLVIAGVDDFNAYSRAIGRIHSLSEFREKINEVEKKEMDGQ